jgi:hypothetical protein
MKRAAVRAGGGTWVVKEGESLAEDAEMGNISATGSRRGAFGG